MITVILSYARALRMILSWIELWTVAMTSGLPRAERSSAHSVKVTQSSQGAPLLTTSPVPPGIDGLDHR